MSRPMPRTHGDLITIYRVASALAKAHHDAGIGPADELWYVNTATAVLRAVAEDDDANRRPNHVY